MHKNFDDQKLEELLSRMPKVKDLQNPDELFESIASRLELEEDHEQEKPRRKKKNYIIPILASIAAVSLLALIIPSVFQNSKNDSALEKANQSEVSTEEQPFNEGEMKGFSATQPKENQITANENNTISTVKSHVIHEIPSGGKLVTGAIPDENAQIVIPVSYITFEDLPITELLNQMEFRTQEWGLASSILEIGTFKESTNSNTIILDLPVNHNLNQGSALEELFLNSLKVMLQPLGYTTVEFTTEGQKGLELGNYGILQEYSLRDRPKNGYFIYNKELNYPLFLVPVQLSLNGISEFLKGMKEGNQELQLKPSIPQEFTITNINEDIEQSILTLVFEETTQMPKEEEIILMLEAILLTAKDFGFKQVKFTIPGVSTVGKYNIDSPIGVPVAANPVDVLP